MRYCLVSRLTLEYLSIHNKCRDTRIHSNSWRNSYLSQLHESFSNIFFYFNTLIIYIFFNFFLLLGVQINSVHFFVFKNAFISKQNEWTDQLKYYPSLPTTFSHLLGNFRIPSRKNDSSLEAIQFWNQFSISAKEVNRWLAKSCCILRNNQ